MARTAHGLLAALAVSSLAVTLTPLADDRAVAADPESPSLVRVKTPTTADKQRLQRLGLELTESAGKNFVDVVVQNRADRKLLATKGFDYTVKITDLDREAARVARVNSEFAANTTRSDLPSGRTEYRRLEDYTTEMRKLARDNPSLVKHITLEEPSLEGRKVEGIEIAANVKKTDDGRPTFLMMGLHHSREWPSGEMTMEFAIDLINNYGSSDRITSLLKKTRVIIVPVVNPDGFTLSVDDGTGASSTGNDMKRKNCRMEPGKIPKPGECAAAPSPWGYGPGVDLNRNYGAFWGGPGATSSFTDATHYGEGPFSEPETRNVREMMSTGEITMMITNHTHSGLILRPGGLNPETVTPADDEPAGVPYDDAAMKDLGDDMAAQNGYVNQSSWELYDTTGTTEEWSYHATGGYGYTYEIGEAFHPEFPRTVEEYLGKGEFAGKGNREAYLVALEAAANTEHHSVLTGRAKPGATLRLTKDFRTPTWPSHIKDRVDVTTTVARNGKFTWHVNPSTRPNVMKERDRLIDAGAAKKQTLNVGQLSPGETYTTSVTATQDTDLLAVSARWYLKPNLEVEVLKGKKLVASSKQTSSMNERALLDPAPGKYTITVTNKGTKKVHPDVTAAWYETDRDPFHPFAESYTLTCEKNGEVLGTVPVDVERGQRVAVDLPEDCAHKSD